MRIKANCCLTLKHWRCLGISSFAEQKYSKTNKKDKIMIQSSTGRSVEQMLNSEQKLIYLQNNCNVILHAVFKP